MGPGISLERFPRAGDDAAKQRRSFPILAPFVTPLPKPVPYLVCPRSDAPSHPRLPAMEGKAPRPALDPLQSPKPSQEGPQRRTTTPHVALPFPLAAKKTPDLKQAPRRKVGMLSLTSLIDGLAGHLIAGDLPALSTVYPLRATAVCVSRSPSKKLVS